jgi:AAA domain, putative AbiEii toxin, Type IV TA system
MLRSVSIKHFRSFRELALGGSQQPLERINLIAGSNNTGKTAVLEALDLVGNEGTAEVAFDLNRARGAGYPRAVSRDTCSWLFHDRDTSRPLEIEGADSEGTARLQMWLVQKDGEKPEQLPEGNSIHGTPLSDLYLSGFPYLVSHFTGSRGNQRWSTILLGESRGFPAPRESTKQEKCLYLGSSDSLHALYLEFFSRLEVEGRQEELIPLLRRLEPNLKRVSLVVVEGEPALYGDVGQKRLIPLTFMGEGVKRALTFLLAIANVPGGTLLIDEIENGLHHSVLKTIWKTIGEAAEQADVQVFATTHSYECIQAAHQAFSEKGPYNLRVLRLDRLDSEVRVATYNKTTLETSIDMSLEVR